MTVVLASASPRRRELLAGLGVRFAVIPSAIAEREQFPGEDPEQYARSLAEEKAREVAPRHPDDVVLAADTVVALRGQSLGKPRDAADARRMLRLLRGETHLVVTAVVARCAGVEHWSAGRADVAMHRFADEEIDAYVATGEPMDKAGAYAVQGKGGRLVASVSGCYDAVVGLPLGVTADLLRRCGIEVPQQPCGEGRDRARLSTP